MLEHGNERAKLQRGTVINVSIFDQQEHNAPPVYLILVQSNVSPDENLHSAKESQPQPLGPRDQFPQWRGLFPETRGLKIRLGVNV